MKTLKKISLQDGTLMFLNEDYNDDCPGTKEARKAFKESQEKIDTFKMEINTWYDVAGEETYF